MEDIALRSPVNKAAAMVTGQPKEDIRQGLHWLEAPQTATVPETIIDHTGKVCGDFVVYGFFSRDDRLRTRTGKYRPTSQRDRWVLKCTCGRYELRNTGKLTRMINSGKPEGLMCCRTCQLEKLKITGTLVFGNDPVI